MEYSTPIVDSLVELYCSSDGSYKTTSGKGKDMKNTLPWTKVISRKEKSEHIKSVWAK